MKMKRKCRETAELSKRQVWQKHCYPRGKNLRTAATNGELERIEQLLSRGDREYKIDDIDDCDDSGNSALHAACSHGQTVLLCWVISDHCGLLCVSSGYAYMP